jgi:hypothetical protein
LPATKVRALSLENHLAFAVVNARQGSHEQVGRLLRMMYLAYYLRNETASDGDTELYRQAEAALDHCIERSVPSKAWMFTADEQEIIRRVVVLHDEQLMVVPAHRYLRA